MLVNLTENRPTVTDDTLTATGAKTRTVWVPFKAARTVCSSLYLPQRPARRCDIAIFHIRTGTTPSTLTIATTRSLFPFLFLLVYLLVLFHCLPRLASSLRVSLSLTYISFCSYSIFLLACRGVTYKQTCTVCVAVLARRRKLCHTLVIVLEGQTEFRDIYVLPQHGVHEDDWSCVLHMVASEM